MLCVYKAILLVNSPQCDARSISYCRGDLSILLLVLFGVSMNGYLLLFGCVICRRSLDTDDLEICINKIRVPMLQREARSFNQHRT